MFSSVFFLCNINLHFLIYKGTAWTSERGCTPHSSVFAPSVVLGKGFQWGGRCPGGSCPFRGAAGDAQSSGGRGPVFFWCWMAKHWADRSLGAAPGVWLCRAAPHPCKELELPWRDLRLIFRGSGLVFYCLSIIQSSRTVVPAQGTTAVIWEEAPLVSGGPCLVFGAAEQLHAAPSLLQGLAPVSPAPKGMAPGSPFTLSPPLALFCSGLSWTSQELCGYGLSLFICSAAELRNQARGCFVSNLVTILRCLWSFFFFFFCGFHGKNKN